MIYHLCVTDDSLCSGLCSEKTWSTPPRAHWCKSSRLRCSSQNVWQLQVSCIYCLCLKMPLKHLLLVLELLHFQISAYIISYVGSISIISHWTIMFNMCIGVNHNEILIALVDSNQPLNNQPPRRSDDLGTTWCAPGVGRSNIFRTMPQVLQRSGRFLGATKRGRHQTKWWCYPRLLFFLHWISIGHACMNDYECVCVWSLRLPLYIYIYQWILRYWYQ